MYSKGNADFVNIVSEYMDEGEIRAAAILASVSAQITKCRIERGMSQKEFAQLLDVSQGMVSKWESSHYNFSIETLSKICSRLNLTLNVGIKEDFNPIEQIIRDSVKPSYVCDNSVFETDENGNMIMREK